MNLGGDDDLTVEFTQQVELTDTRKNEQRGGVRDDDYAGRARRDSV